MTIPYLPPEIISRIFHFAQPPHNFSTRVTRQAVFKQLGRVSLAWYGFAKEEDDRWMDIYGIIRRDCEPKVEVSRLKLENLRRVCFAEVSHMWEAPRRAKEQEGVRLQAKIFDILNRFSQLEELRWDQYYASTDGVRISNSLSAFMCFSSMFYIPHTEGTETIAYGLPTLIELHSLHLTYTPYDFRSYHHQLKALRHLSLHLNIDDYKSSEYSFAFLRPKHLPLLSSLAITHYLRLDLEETSFWTHFNLCAPQIRFLYLSGRTLAYKRRLSTLIVPCTKLAHLCVVCRNDNVYPFVAAAPIGLLSFTTSWYRRWPSESLTWEKDLQEMYKHLSTASRKTHLYLMPAFNKSSDLEIFNAVGLEWEVLPDPEIGGRSFENDLKTWNELRLRLT